MNIAEVLKQVPAVQLRIIPLTWKVLKDDGTLDDKKVAYHWPELEEAIKEAEAYSKAIAEAVHCLKMLLH